MSNSQAQINSSSIAQEDDMSEHPVHSSRNMLDSFWFADLTCGLFGGILGFLVRIISLHALSTSVASDDSMFYSILSQVDLTIHALIWVAFFAILVVCRTEERRRFLTSSVVNLMIGIIVGSFLAWNFVDMTLGFPLSLTSRIVSFNLMLVQCWLLCRCDNACDDEPVKESPDSADDVVFVV